MMRGSFTQSAITQFYVPPIPATSEQIQPGGDNYRLKRLNPAGYRFRRPIIEPEEGLRWNNGDEGERAVANERSGSEKDE